PMLRPTSRPANSSVRRRRHIMSLLNEARSKAQWLVLIVSVIFVAVHIFGSTPSPYGQFVPFSPIVGRLWIISGIATFFLAAFTVPRWQSFVGWAALLVVFYLIESI